MARTDLDPGSEEYQALVDRHQPRASAIEPDAPPPLCESCNGSGEHAGMGARCPECQGTGEAPK